MAREMAYCDKGHSYDPLVNKVCPYCNGDDANKAVGMTKPDPGMLKKDYDEDMMPTVSGREERNYGSAYEEDDNERTMGAYQREKGIDPVVGWLVALNGKLRGTDYRIHSDNNFIGRSRSMSICIEGDNTISKEDHARISYDTRGKKFYFTPGMGKNIVRLNEKAVFTTTELAPYDIIELGVTKFVFIPFCGGKFDWDQVLAQDKTEGE